MPDTGEKYSPGDTIPCHLEAQDWDDEYVTPTTITIDIFDPNGTQQVDGAAMTVGDTGKYVYYYNSAATAKAGWWKYQGTVVDGTGDAAKTTSKWGGFWLE